MPKETTISIRKIGHGGSKRKFKKKPQAFDEDFVAGGFAPRPSVISVTSNSSICRNPHHHHTVLFGNQNNSRFVRADYDEDTTMIDLEENDDDDGDDDEDDDGKTKNKAVVGSGVEFGTAKESTTEKLSSSGPCCCCCYNCEESGFCSCCFPKQRNAYFWARLLSSILLVILGFIFAVLVFGVVVSFRPDLERQVAEKWAQIGYFFRAFLPWQ